MKTTHNSKQAPYRKNSYKEIPKPSFYNAREEQKPSYNFIEQTKIRIVQENLVSVSGLPTDYDDPDLLGDNQHFGKYGTVDKIIISTQGKNRSAFIQVYITYEKISDAAFAIKAMDGIKIDGREISATFGTTKYCTYFLKQNECRNQKCFYLHGYDTKNELMDGVKNNLDFLDEKSQRIINTNLKCYLQKEKEQKERKQEESDFPTVAETIQYLIDEGILSQEVVNKQRKTLLLDKSCRPLQKTQTPKKEQYKKNLKLQFDVSDESEKSSLKQKSVSSKQQSELSLDQQQQPSDLSNRSNNQSEKHGSDAEEDLVQLTHIVSQLQGNKNKKCHSLSTAASPTKCQKLTDIEEQSVDKTIERRLIKQIMRNNMIFRSKMQFVSVNNVIAASAKQENNRMKNYVRKHLLNQI